MPDQNCPSCEHYKRRMQLWREEAYKLAGRPLRDPNDYNDLSESDINHCVVESGVNVYDGDVYKFVHMLEKMFWEKNK